MSHPRVLVIGAGIVGASIAYHLARAGAEVTVLDGGRPGGVATAGSWAWINASAGNPEPYVRLRMRSMAMWRDLGGTLPGLEMRWGGGLLWDLAPDDLRTYAAEHTSWGYPVELVDRSFVADCEPALADPPDIAAHVAIEGAVEPVQAATVLLDAAGGFGARIMPGRAAVALRSRGGRVTGVQTADEVITADEVVVAAGVGTTALLASIGVDLALDAPSGLLVVSKPTPPLLRGLVMAPELHIRQRKDGCLIAGADFGGTDPGADPERAAGCTFEAMQGLLRRGTSIEFDHFTVGRRPTPKDGYPVVGRPPTIAGLYVAVMHSGVTLAPAVGCFAAAEILGAERDPLLLPYGMERFAEAVN